MTTDSLPPATDCARFEQLLGPWLEHDLEHDADACAFLAQHRSTCAHCRAMAEEIDALVHDAGRLAPLSPPRDLWAGIAQRLEAEVVPLTTAPSAGSRAAVAPPAVRTYTVRRLAIAAAALISVTAGVTWQLANRRPDARATDPAPVVASAAPTATASSIEASAAAPANARAESDSSPTVAVSSPADAASGRARLVANGRAPESLDRTYEREITALRRIVDERFAELDTATVSELRRNLDIIDRAILDSRRALARDPRSAFVSSQLDRALQAKLELLRRVALL